MLAADQRIHLTTTGSPLQYFSDANVQRYLELQNAVKIACHGVAAGFPTHRFPYQSVQMLQGKDDGAVVASTNTMGEIERKTTSSIPQFHTMEEKHLVRSAEFGGGEREPKNYYREKGENEGGISSPNIMTSKGNRGEMRDDGARGSVRRHRSAICESTIASRSKIRPEPRFQRVVTSSVLSQMRKDSRLIAKDPNRFLNDIVDGRQLPSSQNSLHPIHTFSSYLTSFTTQNASQSYQQALENIREKCRQARSRTLLLNLGGGAGESHPKYPVIQNQSSRASSAGFETFVNGKSDGNCAVRSNSSTVISSPWDYCRSDADIILQSYLDDIRNVDVENLKIWVEAPATLNDVDLPIGLPTSGVLRIPTKNLEAITSVTCQEFLKSALEEFFLLDAEYHGKLEELSGKITDNFRELELASWKPNDSAILFYLQNMTSQSKSHQHFSSEKLCTEVAIRLFQGRYARDEIIAQKYRLKVKKALEEKRDSVIKHWLVDKDKLVKKVNAAWEDIQRQEQRKVEWSKEKKAQQEKCQYWMDLLERMRKENTKKVRTISAMVEPLEEQIRRKQKVKEAQERSRRLEQKELLERFQRLKMENEEEERRNREEIQIKLEKDQQLRKIQNRARVHLRRQEYFEKKENEKEMERRKEEIRREREELLEKTKEKVEIDYNPWNVLSDTHSSLVRSHEIQSLVSLREEEAEESKRFFQERYSFSAETLWKDSRVRLESKLREAGLIGNSYARQVLLAMQPKEKPHLQSQIKFDEQQ